MEIIMNNNTSTFLQRLYSTMAVDRSADDTLDPTGNY